MAKRIAVYLIGLAVNALGIAFIIYSSTGAGSWDTVAIGLYRHIGFTIGICTTAIQIVVVIVIAIIERKHLQYGSIIAISIRSFFLDVWTYLVFNHLPILTSWELQWFIFILGTLGLGVGSGIYLEAHFPNSPIDGLMIALHNRFHWNLNISRIIVEVIGVLLGFLLGGPVGLGTLFVTLSVGKIIQVSNNKLKGILAYESKTVPVSEIKERL